MRVAFRIALRYFLSKQSLNVINLIARISTVGVMVATASLIVILSVFNGLETIIVGRFNAFNPNLKVSLNEGKYISINDSLKHQLDKISNIQDYSFTFQEFAVVKYGKKMHPFTLKGVDDNFTKVSGLDTMLLEGEFMLKNSEQDFAIVGSQVAQKLSVGIYFITPLTVYAPKRMLKSVQNPMTAFSKKHLFPSAIFGIDESADDKLVVPLSFTQELYQAENLATNIEIKLKDIGLLSETQKELQSLLGDDFVVKNQREQNEFYKILNAERFMIYMILSFVLLIAGFNIIAMTTMLIVDKKKDFITFQSIGLSTRQIKYVFLFTGWITSIAGAILGLVLGGLLAWMQIEFSIIQFGDGYAISAYPIDVEAFDFVKVFFLVLVIGFLTSLLPVRNFERNYLT